MCLSTSNSFAQYNNTNQRKNLSDSMRFAYKSFENDASLRRRKCIVVVFDVGKIITPTYSVSTYFICNVCCNPKSECRYSSFKLVHKYPYYKWKLLPAEFFLSLLSFLLKNRVKLFSHSHSTSHFCPSNILRVMLWFMASRII